MHCEDPGCLRACPADGAIIKYENGIVDFQQENCIGCGYCISGCPFDIPKFNPKTNKVFKCTLCSDRVGQGLEPACIKSCPTGCLHFGTKEDMVQIARSRVSQLQNVSGFANAGVYDPQSIGGTHVIYVLHDITQPELYGGLPSNPIIPPSYTIWKWLAKPTGLALAAVGVFAVFFHRVVAGAKLPQPANGDFAIRNSQSAIRDSQSEIRNSDLLRHPVYTRVLHWSVAIAFILALLSGFAIYSPWLFRWLTPLFGGGPMTRLLHPWFGLAFTIAFFFQFLNWFAPMTWTDADSRWMKRIRAYASNQEKLEPAETGFFNGGQKVYFWTIVGSAVVFLITGFLMWFDHVVPRWVVVVSYVLHDIAALVMLAGLIIHIYEGTAAQPGTFRSMIDGTVTRAWAWTHHPAWYSEVTGRNAREDYQQAVEESRKK